MMTRHCQKQPDHPTILHALYYDSHDRLRRHLDNFANAYNFGRRLKRLRGLMPQGFICKTWTTRPERFTLNRPHQMPGLKI